MATRTAGRRQGTPRAGHARPGSTAQRPPAGNGTAASYGPDWSKVRQAYEARRDAAKERPELYPFTISGIPIRPLYTHEDLAGTDLARDLALPGEYPYTRGIHTTMYRGRMFTMRQFAGFGT